jgi:hypothetical protein
MTGIPVGVVLAEGLPWTAMRIVTPLGIRFRDIALEGPITNDLVVLVTFSVRRTDAAQREPVRHLPGSTVRRPPLEYPTSLDAPVGVRRRGCRSW